MSPTGRIVLTGYHISEPITSCLVNGEGKLVSSKCNSPKTFDTLSGAAVYIENNCGYLRDQLNELISTHKSNELHICCNRTGNIILVFEV